MPEPSPTTKHPPFGPRALDPARGAGIAEVVRAGLSATPKTLPPVLFYDRLGSQLFEQICSCAEYYLTRTEGRILTDHAATLAAALPRDVTLAELGCGSAEKTEILLRALLGAGHRVRFVACDVSEPSLLRTARRLRTHVPALEVVPLLGDFDDALQEIPRLVVGTCVWAFLGSSIGNFDPSDADAFLARVRRAAKGPLVIGADMVKERELLLAAYDDARGVTAAFNRNVLTRINRELDADFAIDRFAHAAIYRDDLARIEMHLVSQAEQTVRIRALDLEVAFARGETIHTENSHKYTAPALARMAAAAGFLPGLSLSDARGWFTVALWTPA